MERQTFCGGKVILSEAIAQCIETADEQLDVLFVGDVQTFQFVNKTLICHDNTEHICQLIFSG